MHVAIYFRLKSPMSHGDPALNNDNGNFREFRKQHVVGFGSVPVLAGNAIRGVMRRMVMRHFLDTAEMSPSTYADRPGHWDRIYAALANGGTLTGAEKSVRTQALRDLRAACPPLSLLGSALYTQMLPGMCSIFDAYPQCKEMYEAGLTDASTSSLSDMYGDRHHARHISPDIDKAAAEITPMPYTNEVMYPGSVLQGGILFDRLATEIERDCAAWAVAALKQLGGNKSKGFGLVDITTSEPIGDAARYESWMLKHAAQARGAIEQIIPARA